MNCRWPIPVWSKLIEPIYLQWNFLSYLDRIVNCWRPVRLRFSWGNHPVLCVLWACTMIIIKFWRFGLVSCLHYPQKWLLCVSPTMTWEEQLVCAMAPAVRHFIVNIFAENIIMHDLIDMTRRVNFLGFFNIINEYRNLPTNPLYMRISGYIKSFLKSFLEGSWTVEKDW